MMGCQWLKRLNRKKALCVVPSVVYLCGGVRYAYYVSFSLLQYKRARVNIIRVIEPETNSSPFSYYVCVCTSTERGRSWKLVPIKVVWRASMTLVLGRMQHGLPRSKIQDQSRSNPTQIRPDLHCH